MKQYPLDGFDRKKQYPLGENAEDIWSKYLTFVLSLIYHHLNYNLVHAEWWHSAGV